MLDKKTIGERLKKAREAAGMTRSLFAENAGIDISQYSKAERGIEGLGPDKIQQIIKTHGISGDFMGQEKEKFSKHHITELRLKLMSTQSLPQCRY